MFIIIASFALCFALLCGVSRECLRRLVLWLRVFQVRDDSRRMKVKQPECYEGGLSPSLREWLFSIEENLQWLGIPSGPAQVGYAATFLSGNAKRWFISLVDSGTRPATWPDMKLALKKAFSSQYEEERSRLSLLRLKQTGSLEDYVREFSQLSLLTPGLDDHTRCLLFTEGLSDTLRKDVLREHPACVADAIRSARTLAHFSPTFSAFPVPDTERAVAMEVRNKTFRPLSSSDRDRLLRERRCFVCRQRGHQARHCRQSRAPNASRQ